MRKEYCFARGKWSEKELCYAHSPACMDRVKFRQEEDAIVNSKGKSFCGYEMITLLEKTKRSVGATAEAECSFESFGAPLLVLTDDLSQNSKGEMVYGEYFEAVAFESGCNLWAVTPAKEEADCPISATKLQTNAFTIEGNTRVLIKMQVCEKKIKAWVNGHYTEAVVENLPTSFYMGITACEGINRFYSFAVED